MFATDRLQNGWLARPHEPPTFNLPNSGALATAMSKIRRPKVRVAEPERPNRFREFPSRSSALRFSAEVLNVTTNALAHARMTLSTGQLMRPHYHDLTANRGLGYRIHSED